MTDKMLAWCRVQGLLCPGGRVLIALSGGADSTAMLHLLLSLRKRLDLTLEAAHFNHHLRGAEADRDESFCRGLCQTLGVKLHLGGADVTSYANAHGLGLEEAARTLRYDFLRTAADGAKIATAHTCDDNLETMLMNLLRGCALRGLAGIPPRRGAVIRPVLCLTHDELVCYLKEHKWTWVEDSTNETDAFLRNRIRHDALPALSRELPALSCRALETAMSLRADEQYLQSRADALLLDASRPGGYDAKLLCGAPEPLRLRALFQILQAAGACECSRAHLLAADALLSSRNPAARLNAPGCVLRRQYGLLTAESLQVTPPIAPQPVLIPGALSLPNGLLRCEYGVFTPGTLPYPNAFALDPACARGLTVRSRLPGDLLTGPGGTKPLQKWMIDRKIPAHLRQGVPVLAANGRVLAAFGVAADPIARAQPGEDALLVTYEKEKQ